MTASEAIVKNIRFTQQLIQDGKGPNLIGTVCGSSSGQSFWNNVLSETKKTFGSELALSLHEDLPVGQAFGLLYLWHQIKDQVQSEWSTLIAFVFGSGTRSTPFTEHNCGQKPAIASFVLDRPESPQARFLSMVELAMQYFIGVQNHLYRSGFRGLVVKWGDEVQVPIADLSTTNPLLDGADIVRFVSLEAMTEDIARNKDWVGVDEKGYITQFIPRRSMAEMEKLAAQGLLTKNKNGELVGGINLGSIAVSFNLLDVLLDEFSEEVFQTDARYSDRPALDPEFFTALTIAAISDPDERQRTWNEALNSSQALQKLTNNVTDVFERLSKALQALEVSKGSPAKFVVMDFEGQYWGDIGQHHKIFDFYLGLNSTSTDGEIARAIAGIESAERDAKGNILVNSSLGSAVDASNSVFINAHIESGSIRDSVLLGSTAKRLDATHSFDVMSVVSHLVLGERSGAYRVVSQDPIELKAAERATTIFQQGKEPLLYKVLEDTNLQNKAETYNVKILDNPTSFKDVHEAMSALDHKVLAELRNNAETSVKQSF